MSNPLYAPLWRRIAASVIDTSFFVSLLFGILFVSYNLFSPKVPLSLLSVFDLVLLILSIFIPFMLTLILEVLFISSTWQATPGKRVMNIFIGHKGDGLAISKFKALFRISVRYIVILLFMLGASFLINEQEIFNQTSLFDLKIIELGVLLIVPTVINLFSMMVGTDKITIHDFICTTRVYNGKTH